MQSGACPEIKCGGGGSIGSKRKGRKGVCYGLETDNDQRLLSRDGLN